MRKLKVFCPKTHREVPFTLTSLGPFHESRGTPVELIFLHESARNNVNAAPVSTIKVTGQSFTVPRTRYVDDPVMELKVT